MTGRHRFALSEDELRTIGFLAGLGLVIFWGVTGFRPDNLVAGIVASLLILQRALPSRKDKTDDVERSPDRQVRSEGIPVDRDLDRPHNDVDRRDLGRIRLRGRPA